MLVDDAVAPPDDHNGARQFVARNRSLHERGNRRETAARFDRGGRRLRGKPDDHEEGREGQRHEGMFHGIQYILNLYRGF
jgi:hypothetical protein